MLPAPLRWPTSVKRKQNTKTHLQLENTFTNSKTHSQKSKTHSQIQNTFAKVKNTFANAKHIHKILKHIHKSQKHTRKSRKHIRKSKTQSKTQNTFDPGSFMLLVLLERRERQYSRCFMYNLAFAAVFLDFLSAFWTEIKGIFESASTFAAKHGGRGKRRPTL